jgi:sentrin-specific protease 1
MSYLMDESLDKLKVPLEREDWDLITASVYNKLTQDCPEQENGYDCGVFVCMFMRSIALRQSFNFNQKDMRGIRYHMAMEIINKTLL